MREIPDNYGEGCLLRPALIGPRYIPDPARRSCETERGECSLGSHWPAEDFVRRFFLVVAAVIGIYLAARVARHPTTPTSPAPRATPAVAPAVPRATPTASVSDNAAIMRAFTNHARDIRVDGSGAVSRVLADDNQGARHQRFLVRLPTGQSILIVHNIDIAPRVENLRVGDEIEFEGEYVWNAQGGLVHWTHHDPSGKHRAGWVKHAGHEYQ